MCKEVKRDAPSSNAHDDPLRFLIGGDHLGFLFSQGNDFRNFNLLPCFFWHTDKVGCYTPLLARGDGCARMDSCGKALRSSGLSLPSLTIALKAEKIGRGSATIEVNY